MADGLMRKKVTENNLDIVVDSAGTSGFHVGEAPDNRMRETAKERNTPIDDLRARQFSVDDFDNFDLIYAMDSGNLKNILSLARNENDRKKVKLILNESHPGKDLEVPDPYYGGERGFLEVYDMLDEATDVILEKLINGKR